MDSSNSGGSAAAAAAVESPSLQEEHHETPVHHLPSKGEDLDGPQYCSSDAAVLSPAVVSSDVSPKSDCAAASLDDIDRLGSRLERLVQVTKHSVVGSLPSPRKNSAGSQIPKPEIAPKPNLALISSSASKGGGAATSSASQKSPPLQKPSKPPTTTTATPSTKDASSQLDSKTKATGTAAMLKSTLKRMTRMAISSPSSSTKEKEGTEGSSSSAASVESSSLRKLKDINPLKLKGMVQSTGPPPPPPSMSAGQRNTVMSSSLRRPARKEREDQQQQQHQTMTFQRSGTGGTLDRRNGVNRSQSVTGRRFRDRDLNVKYSRAVQTQLTRDSLADEDDAAADGESGVGCDGGSTSVEFSLFLPELLGAETDVVETHVSEPTEPADVRKNRQLTLDNMKLHREVERLRSQVTENDALKKELRSVRSKVEEEQKKRAKIEQELDSNRQRVREIAESMDGVEKEFLDREGNIRSLEARIEEYNSANVMLQLDVDARNDALSSLQAELEKSLATQKMLMEQYQDAETESRELQEFVHEEKMTLAETLKDSEGEIDALKSQVGAAEERCCHLVRLGEQRHQEALTMQAQLSAAQDRTKDMLLSQGAEISRAYILMSELYSRLEKLIGGDDLPNGPPSLPGSSTDEAHSDTVSDDAVRAADAVEAADAFLRPPSFAEFPRSNSQFLVSTRTSLASSVDLCSNISGMTSSAHMADGGSNGGGSGSGSNSSVLEMSESLQNLSKAIAQRQRSENGGMESSLASSSSNGSLPSLVDRISDVQLLIDRFMMKQQLSRLSNGTSEIAPDVPRKINNKESEEKENVAANGVHNHDQFVELLKCKDNEIQEMKKKFLKHREILLSNNAQAENEIHRIDDIYHNTVENVLKALSTIPDIVSMNIPLQQLKRNLELSFGDGGGGGKGLRTTTDISASAAVALKADNMNANHSL